ncbi:MAG: hypothetical protein KBD01_01615 [Acidobacteria bacterium]|nr:hypothetical protein [Acidobacteriota bacterium]
MTLRALAPEVVEGLVDRVSARLREELASIPPGAPERRTPEPLRRAAAALRAASGQADVLRAVLAGACSLGARAALFVVRPDGLEGWESAGFENDPALAGSVRGKKLRRDEPAVAAALQGHAPVAAGAAEPEALPGFGQAPRATALLLPLAVNGKVAAMVYVDSADPDHEFDRPGIELLVDYAGLAVERLAIARLTRAAEQPAASAPAAGAPPPAFESAPHARPAFESAPQARPAFESAPQARPAFESAPQPRPAPTAPPAPAPAAPPQFRPLGAPPAGAAPEIEDARRFARLLMEEICLYHGDKVDEGRARRDILARLSEELDRARQLFEQRVPVEVRQKGEFFDEALVRVLAGGDPAALGTGERAPS